MSILFPDKAPFSTAIPWKQIYTWKGGGRIGENYPTDLLIKGGQEHVLPSGFLPLNWIL